MNGTFVNEKFVAFCPMGDKSESDGASGERTLNGAGPKRHKF
jgi:hypothetical protein